MPIKLNGATSGSVELDVPATVSGGDVTLTLPTADGSAGQVLSTNASGALSFVNRVEWDQFQLIQNKSSNGTLTEWARCSYAGFGQVGGQMTHSSGTWTFPSTGHYLIIGRPTFSIDGADTCTMVVKVTTDNSTYTGAGKAYDGLNNSSAGTERYGSSAVFTFVDVTDTSNVKVQFEAESLSGNSNFLGGPSDTALFTTVTFIRLGDT